MNRARFFSYALLPSIIIGGAILRFIEIGRESLWFDELFTIWAGSLPFKDMIAEGSASGHPFLYNLVSSIWLSVSSNDAWMRTISLISGVATIYFIYLLGKEFVSRRTGLWAAGLAAVSPFLFYYSREATDKALSIVLASASLYFLVRSVNRGGWISWTAYVVASGLVLFAHFYGFFLVVGEVLFYFVAYDKKHSRFREWLISQFALVFILILWFLSNRGSTRWVDFNIPAMSTVLQNVFQHGPVSLIGLILPLNNGDVSFPGTFYIYYSILAAGILTVFGLLLYSADSRGKILNRKNYALALLVLILITLPVISQLLRNYYTSVRYFAWASTPFILLAAILITSMPRKIGAIAGAITIIGSLALTGWSLQTYHFDDLRGIMSTISQEKQTGDRLLCFPLSECSMAADHYLNNGPVFIGGYIDSMNSIDYYPSGVVWAGYDTGEKYGGRKRLSGKELKERVISDVEGAERIWVLGGDGSVDRIKPADPVYNIIDLDWQVDRQFSYPPYLLRLYVHKG
ncbi:MAG: glycosyltransferase family 39 protein [Actinobacteria bacterium]|nr:glycosyltransferase family 39 protein [Actinomycetota bacterium]